MEMDLTQTSFSTVPSIDLEVGDTASDYSESTLNVIADGIVLGLDGFFQNQKAADSTASAAGTASAASTVSTVSAVS